jgi:uncharacterized protein (TIGR02996 family)
MKNANFLAALRETPDDRKLLSVYADWLEERSDQRGEYLRLLLALWASVDDEAKAHQLRFKLERLRSKIDSRWIATIDQTMIENCSEDNDLLEFAFQCPRRWEKLRVTDESAVRFCDTCLRNVYYCCDIKSARASARRGNCVAVDSSLTRKKGDLQEPERTMSLGRIHLYVHPAEIAEEEGVEDTPQPRRRRRDERRRNNRRHMDEDEDT